MKDQLLRYLLFGGDTYYPSGGWLDFQGSFDNIEDAEDEARGDWYHIVDMQTGEIVRDVYR